nr:immunoglobulin heavy chain junction region [Macaca mulatta]MOW18972.1 immunoglobulin heavy chain junction region [Macaca mulatta]MOW19369.1 immunoglobulin heavy chain junction region [Macaca mulatta]MOW19405.1 immunoglobulin heavy chain junction region [Macaca mulatta]MOW19637.1 immunoglobulin heavy chain junction region [Macaca mulatta]
CVRGPPTETMVASYWTLDYW